MQRRALCQRRKELHSVICRWSFSKLIMQLFGTPLYKTLTNLPGVGGGGGTRPYSGWDQSWDLRKTDDNFFGGRGCWQDDWNIIDIGRRPKSMDQELLNDIFCLLTFLTRKCQCAPSLEPWNPGYATVGLCFFGTK